MVEGPAAVVVSPRGAQAAADTIDRVMEVIIPDEISTTRRTEGDDAVDRVVGGPDVDDVVTGPTGSATTQTPSDSVDGLVEVPCHLLTSTHRPDQPSQSESGFLANLLTMVMSKKEEPSSESDPPTENQAQFHSVATQTEELDPISARGQQLTFMIIEELGMERPLPSSSPMKDIVYETLLRCVKEILVKHWRLFSGMIQRTPVNEWYDFKSVADEIFEMTILNTVDGTTCRKVTWGRIISLFAFAVRLTQKYRQDEEKVDMIVRFMASYLTKNLIPFVRSNGGWEKLVEIFPSTDENQELMKQTLMLSSVVAGLVGLYMFAHR